MQVNEDIKRNIFDTKIRIFFTEIICGMHNFGVKIIYLFQNINHTYFMRNSVYF